MERISTYNESPYSKGDLNSSIISSLSNLVIALRIGGINGIPSIIAPSDDAPASLHVIISCDRTCFTPFL